MKKTKMSPLDLAYIGMFVALIAICSWISIPMAIPVTLQTFAIFATVAMLGTKRAVITIFVYMCLGMMGVPVFSNFGAGVGVLFGNTGGYMIGFVFAALITGGILKRFGKKLPVMIVAMVLGLLICYVFGTIWFIYIYGRSNGGIGVMAALSICVLPYIIPDLLKIALAIFLDRRLSRFIK